MPDDLLRRLVTAKSTGGNITASGLAIQANATLPGGTGGVITVEAKGHVTLDEAQILAKGDAVPAGDSGLAGRLRRARSAGP